MTGLGVLAALFIVAQLALRWHGRRQLRGLAGVHVAIPDGWHLVGIALIDDDGQAQFVNLEDPVEAAERVTREASWK